MPRPTVPTLQLKLRAQIAQVQLSNAWLRLRLKFLHRRFHRLLARHPNSRPADPTHKPIPVLLLHFGLHNPTPVRAQLCTILPTLQVVAPLCGGPVGGPLAAFDASFLDVVGLSHELALGAVPPPDDPLILMCGADVHILGPVLFAGLRDELNPDIPGEDKTTDDLAFNLLGALSLLSFEELLDFYLPDMDIEDRMAATRAFNAGEEWVWGELPETSQAPA